MNSTSALLRSALLGTLLIVGCESGTDIAGIGSATAQRDPDGHVIVAVTMTCETVYGVGISNSKCDADDEEACVVAEWYDASDANFTTVQARGKACRELEKVRGATITVRSVGIIPPDRALKIRVYPSPELDARDDRPTIVTIDSP